MPTSSISGIPSTYIQKEAAYINCTSSRLRP